MIDETTPRGASAAARLRDDLILWLTTVTADGQAQTSPVWFLRDGDELLVYSRLNTPRMENLRQNPRVAASLDGDGRGGGVVSLEGEARVVTTASDVLDVPAAYLAKYQALLDEAGWTMASMLVDYPVTIRIRLTRVRTW